MTILKQSKPADPAELVTATVGASTEVCPYCHKLLDEENGGCRLAHEHGEHHVPRERRPTYAELEDENRALRAEVESLKHQMSRMVFDQRELGWD